MIRAEDGSIFLITHCVTKEVKRIANKQVIDCRFLHELLQSFQVWYTLTQIGNYRIKKGLEDIIIGFLISVSTKQS